MCNPWLCLASALALASAASASAASPSPPSRELWLAVPLFPGQDLLAKEAEAKLAKLLQGLPDLVGTAVLERALTGRPPPLGCAKATVPCTDPFAAALAELGLSRATIVGVGQDDRGFHARVFTIDTTSTVKARGEATRPNLEDAVLAAVVRVIPIGTALEITSTPDGASVTLDGVPVGITPVSAHVLPGERILRLERAGFRPHERRITVPASAPAMRIAVELLPPVPERVPDTQATIAQAQAPAPDHGGPTVYARRSYLDVGVDWSGLAAGAGVRASGLSASGQRALEGVDGALFTGLSLDYGVFGRHFGILVIGLSYHDAAGPIAGRATQTQVLTGARREDVIALRAGLFGVRLLQPGLRWAYGRLQLGLHVGPEGRIGLYKPLEGQPSAYDGGFLNGSLDLAVAPHARLFVAAGLFAEIAYRRVQPLLGSTGALDVFRAGIGYAF